MDEWLGSCIGERTKEKIQVNELKNKQVDIQSEWEKYSSLGKSAPIGYPISNN